MARPLRATESVSAEISRNLALELVRVTEAGALASARWMGRGDKNTADGAAVDAMRRALGMIPMDGVVVIGEGEKDEAPMLYIGEQIGTGDPPQVDVAVDPIDGTTLLSKGLPNAISVVAMAAGRGSLYDAKHVHYMHKIATGADAAGLDLLMGIGGSPEAVLAAAALKCLGGEIQCKLYARNPEEKEKAEAAGATFDRVLGIDDLVRSDDVFFAATGVTDGEVLQGVKYHMNWAETESLVTRSRSGTLRRIYARHHWGYKQREWLGQPEEG